MSEEEKLVGGNGKDDKAQEPKDLALSIKISQATGQVHVQAPGDGKLINEPISFWMLDKAKDFIKAVNRQATQSTLVKPRPSIRDIFPRSKRRF